MQQGDLKSLGPAILEAHEFLNTPPFPKAQEVTAMKI